MTPSKLRAQKVISMHRNSNPKLSTLRLITAATVLSTMLMACGGGGTTSVTRTGTSATAAAQPVITSITPTSAQAGVSTQFTVAGTDIPLTSIVALTGGTCGSPTNATALGFLVTCTPGATLGAVAAVINNNTLANGGWWIGQLTVTITAAVTGVSLLTDTGITANQCYGAGSDALISCTSAAAIALNAQQDGMMGRDVTNPDGIDGWLGSSYSISTTTTTTITPTSTTIATTTNPNCIKDNVMGLTWQRASTTLTSSTVSNLETEAIGLRDAANSSLLCGFSDWRLPTPPELQSLVSYGLNNSSPAIDLNWFSSTLSTWYFTDTRYTSGSGLHLWGVNFANGSVGDSFAQQLRLVR